MLNVKKKNIHFKKVIVIISIAFSCVPTYLKDTQGYHIKILLRG